jgi:hypothetical protein
MLFTCDKFVEDFTVLLLPALLNVECSGSAEHLAMVKIAKAVKLIVHKIDTLFRRTLKIKMVVVSSQGMGLYAGCIADGCCVDAVVVSGALEAGVVRMAIAAKKNIGDQTKIKCAHGHNLWEH